MIVCDRCGKRLKRYRSAGEGDEMRRLTFESADYDVCSECFDDYESGHKQIDDEINGLYKQRFNNWLNEWLRNKPRAKD